MSRQIHPTAVVDPTAELGEDVVVGPYVVINAHVRVGDRTKIGPQVVVGAWPDVRETLPVLLVSPRDVLLRIAVEVCRVHAQELWCGETHAGRVWRWGHAAGRQQGAR